MPDFAIGTDRSIFPLIIDTINSAKKNLCLSFFQFAITPQNLKGIPLNIFSSIKSRQQDGVEVKILINQKFANSIQHEINRKTNQFLQSNGINIKWTNPRKVNHTKLIIADGERAYIGSANLTITSLADNWEIGVVIKSGSINEILVPYFNKLWEIAQWR